MYISITTALLLLVIACMICLRLMWSHVPLSAKKLLIAASLGFIVLHMLEITTKWEIASDRFNIVSAWCFIAGYVLLILLLTTLSPRWLTTLSAIVLLLPLFATSIILPLTPLFAPHFSKEIRIGNHLSYQVNPWTNAGAGIPGADLQVYYRPSFAPFLRRRFQSTPFNAQQCDFNAAFAEPGPLPGTALARCPHWPTQSAGTIDRILPLSQSPSHLTRIP